MILIIDNYDSFVYNIARYVAEAGEEVEVIRNDALTVAEIVERAPDRIILSPGPCTPFEAGVTMQVIEKLGPYTPILGICLGHQAIGAVFGGRVTRAKSPSHGRAEPILTKPVPLFAGCPTTFLAGCYYSLIVEGFAESEEETDSLFVTARSKQGEIMAIQHKSYPIYGVQFHPESILTPWGRKIIQNFLNTKGSRE